MKKKTSIKLTALQYMGQGWHYVCPTTINGKKVFFILDTGATRTVLDLSYTHNLKNKGAIVDNSIPFMGATGLGESKFGLLDKVKIGDIEIREYHSMFVDIQAIISIHSQFDGVIVGVLGSDILEHYGAVIDLRKKEVRFQWDTEKVKEFHKKEANAFKRNILSRNPPEAQTPSNNFQESISIQSKKESKKKQEEKLRDKTRNHTDL